MEKTSLLKQIIVKLFCLHDMKRIDSIEHMDAKGQIISKTVLYVCDKCGTFHKETI